MNKKPIYTALISCAIALNGTSLKAEENSQPDFSNTVFVCAVQEEIPTMFAYTPGEVNLTSLMSWHSEYLLPEQSGAEICQQTANKLQASIEQKNDKFLKAYTEKESQKNLVCLVDEKKQTCAAEDSEKLFSVNPNYSAGCVLSNKNPLECMALNVRGVYSYSEQPYQPLWWPW
ncbi:MAG: hypothetical protein ACFCAD_17745 [Pleurocapsa sp.]